jgi:hypothetical protein
VRLVLEDKNMASSMIKYDNTTRVATNANLDVRTMGAPRRVLINNITNACRFEWNDTMADGYGIKTVAAGTRSVVSSGGITPLAGSGDDPPGFRIGGALADINDTTTEVLHIEVWT